MFDETISSTYTHKDDAREMLNHKKRAAQEFGDRAVLISKRQSEMAVDDGIIRRLETCWRLSP